jgi:hypothetical protein
MDITMRRPVRACAHFDYEAGTLQIELANDCAITLTFHYADDEKPTVNLWAGNGEKDFDNFSREQWHEWLDMALEQKA